MDDDGYYDDLLLRCPPPETVMLGRVMVWCAFVVALTLWALA